MTITYHSQYSFLSEFFLFSFTTYINTNTNTNTNSNSNTNSCCETNSIEFDIHIIIKFNNDYSSI